MVGFENKIILFFRGGVFSPGAAFAKTNIISELCNNGFTFEVLSENSNV